MGPLVIMVVLVCGFWFTENHYQSRIRHARTDGWTSYFYVAMHGCKFVIQGFCLILFIYLFLVVVSLIFSIPHLFVSTYGIKDYYSWLTNNTALSYPLFFLLSVIPMDEVETLSLFDTSTYQCFDEFINKRS